MRTGFFRIWVTTFFEATSTVSHFDLYFSSYEELDCSLMRELTYTTLCRISHQKGYSIIM